MNASLRGGLVGRTDPDLAGAGSKILVKDCQGCSADVLRRAGQLETQGLQDKSGSQGKDAHDPGSRVFQVSPAERIAGGFITIRQWYR